MKFNGEQTFETVIETSLLSNGYIAVPREDFDRKF